VCSGEAGHLRGASNDQEIPDRCELLRQVTGNPATLIAGDSGMRTSAQSRGTDVFKLPDSDLPPRPATAGYARQPSVSHARGPGHRRADRARPRAHALTLRERVLASRYLAQ
jgi:hypothetical protein